MKTFLFILLFLFPFVTQAVSIAWSVDENPSGKTVNGVTLGDVTHITILDAGNETSLTSDNYNQFQEVISSVGHYDEEEQELFAGTGENLSVSLGKKGDFTEGHNYIIVITDAKGNFFGSNLITAYDGGWFDPPTETDPKSIWIPDWYRQNNGEKLLVHKGDPDYEEHPDSKWGWQFSGTVPEPSSLAAILLGTLFLLSRRKNQA